MTEAWSIWGDQDTSLTYLTNLTGLIEGVRAEMFAASAPGAWRCPEEIPAVIVQLGSWPGGARAERVRHAQVQFCAGDPRAELVTMADTSPFYHFDAASFLVGGHRMAAAYGRALRASVSCPTSAPSTNAPTSTRTSVPSVEPTRAVSSEVYIILCTSILWHSLQ